MFHTLRSDWSYVFDGVSFPLGILRKLSTDRGAPPIQVAPLCRRAPDVVRVTSSCRLAPKVVRVVDVARLDPKVVREVPSDEPEEGGVGCLPYLGPRDVLPVGPQSSSDSSATSQCRRAPEVVRVTSSCRLPLHSLHIQACRVPTEPVIRSLGGSCRTSAHSSRCDS